MWMVGQTAGGDGLSGVLTTVGQYGISAVFIFLYFNARKEFAAALERERTERREAQATLAAFVDRHATVFRDAVEALEGVQKAMSVQVERAGASDRRNDTDITIRRLEMAADELIAQTRRRPREEEVNR